MVRQQLVKNQQDTSKGQGSQKSQEPVVSRAAVHPVLQLQRILGNRAVQRWIESTLLPVQREVFLSPEESEELDAADDFAARLGQRQGLGSPLSAQVRALLEPHLGIDLSPVRVHTGGEAHDLADAVNATAFTTGTDIFFRDGAYSPYSSDGRRLLAHEATHVLQQYLGPVEGNPVEGGSIAVSDPSDCFEREADSVAEQVMATSAGGGLAVEVSSASLGAVGGAAAVQREEEDDGWFSGLGNLLESAGSAVASGAGAVWDAGSAAVGDVGSAIASGAETAWDVGSGAASDIYAGMKQAGKAVHGAKQWAEGGISDLMSMSKEGWNMLAEEAQGIPVLEDVASGAAWLGGTAADVTGGVLKGATNLVGGVVGMAVNPVDTAIGLEGLAEHARILPGMANPLQVVHGLYNVVANDADLGAELNRTLNPAEVMRGDYNMLTGLATGIAKPYMDAYEKGNYGEMAGRGAFDIGMLLLGAGEVGAAAEGAEALGVAGELGTVAEGAEALGAVGELGTAAEGAEALSAVSELGTAAEGAEAIGALGEGVEAAGVLGEAAEAETALTGMRIESLGTPTGELASLSESEIDAFLAGIDNGGAEAGSFFEFPGQNPQTGGGLQDITTRINPNPNQINYNVNHYFSDVGSVQIADMAEVPIGAPRGLGGSVIPEGIGTTAEATPQTFLSTVAEDNPVLNAAGESIGNSNAEVRYHSTNPRFPEQGPTVQINTPSDRFGWAGNRAIAVEGQTGRYLLPDGTWKTIREMTDAERTAAHWPVGH